MPISVVFPYSDQWKKAIAAMVCTYDTYGMHPDDAIAILLLLAGKVPSLPLR